MTFKLHFPQIAISLFLFILILDNTGTYSVYAQSSSYNPLYDSLMLSGLIQLPEGTFDMKGTTIKLDDYTEIKGAGKDKTILKNVMFECRNGLTLENLTIDGGNNVEVQMTALSPSIENVAVILYPQNSSAQLIYKNVSFRNLSIASFIAGNGKVSYDSADHCDFSNISKVAIYHSINSDKSVYTYNTFSNIGNSGAKSGRISAIWIGDVTNNTYAESANVIITNNTFQNLYTSNDDSFTSHIINANFISVRALQAQINNNYVSGIYGYGEDREAIYTKVKNLEVIDNVITNGGYGEGYITCKGHEGANANATIKGNVLSGIYGSGIYLYGPGIISGNTISISNCQTGIANYGRNNQTENNVIIKDNKIISEPGINISDTIISAKEPRSFIYISNEYNTLTINNNTLKASNTRNLWKNAIDICTATKNIVISNNNIDVGHSECCGIFIHANEAYSIKNQNINISVQNNVITNNKTGISIMFKNMSGFTSSRIISIENNNVNCGNNSDHKVYISDPNNDIVRYTSFNSN